MTFTKQEIAEFKSNKEKASYITWRTNLDKFKLKEYFYNEGKYALKKLFPDKNIEYCACENYQLVVGDFRTGLKYVNEQGTYYMFLAANSYWAPAQDVAIGKAVNGTVYLILEGFPTDLGFRCIKITEDYIGPKRQGFVPRSERHTVYIRPSQIEQSAEEITDEDVKCLEIAYEGIKAFSDLIPS